MLSRPESRGHLRVIDALTAVELSRATQLRLLDARDLAPVYYWKHAPGALHTPWRNFTQGRKSGELLPHPLLKERLRSLGITLKDQVLIYGDWERGWGEEARMLWLLEYAGHQRVKLIEGGWRAWVAAGGSYERGTSPSISPSRWEPQWQSTLRVNTAQVRELVTQGVVSLDTRSLSEYEGAHPYGSPYGGHLPQSLHFPWRQVLDLNQRLKTPVELRALFESRGLRKQDPTFTYCTGGVRSAFVYLALREAGFDRAMNYDGSWWAWSRAQ